MYRLLVLIHNLFSNIINADFLLITFIYFIFKKLVINYMEIFKNQIFNNQSIVIIIFQFLPFLYKFIHGNYFLFINFLNIKYIKITSTNFLLI
jgi:hypothetical protein